MALKRFFSLFLLLLSTSVYADQLKDQPGQLIRVGVFPNPPVAFKDSNNEWHGISVDVLRAIAHEKGWKLKFIENSFSGLLQDIEKDRIDIIGLMAYSKKRAQKYRYTKTPLISNWGVVYIRPDAKIHSLLDLNGKRIGVMKHNIHDRGFRKLAKNFSIQYQRVDLANFRDVMKAVRDNKVDAGVANRLFGALNAEKYGLVETGIIFNPINIHYTTLKPDNQVILDAIDEILPRYKSDKSSVYFNSIKRWMNPSQASNVYTWIIWLIAGLGGIILVMAALAYLLRRQVAIRTRELQQEIEERREAERKLDELAHYDALTGLPNRVSLLDELKVAKSRARRQKTSFAVLFIDIDRFKTVNDSLGHDAGDQLIINVAHQLQSCLRDEDSISRFGGDEFVAILQDITDINFIRTITERMLGCFNDSINIESTEIYSSICIGIALYPDDDGSGENLLKYADAAMYHAKAQGGNNYQFYNEKLTQQVHKRLEMETRLRHAIDREEFLLHYQPILDLSTQKPIAVEALLRWQDPEKGLIMPDQFIPLAEETGLIADIGNWVLEHACKQLKEWDAQGYGELQLAINVSSIQFDNKLFCSNLESILQKTGLSANRLELEITERIFLDISDKVISTLNNLRGSGIRLSIDDFGTGYSSLSYLKQLPITTLKIDRSFIMDIPQDRDDMQIATTIISMAHGLEMDVVAEGIETQQQLDFLTSLGCTQGQGYYLSRPQAAETITQWLEKSIKP